MYAAAIWQTNMELMGPFSLSRSRDKPFSSILAVFQDWYRGVIIVGKPLASFFDG